MWFDEYFFYLKNYLRFLNNYFSSAEKGIQVETEINCVSVIYKKLKR